MERKDLAHLPQGLNAAAGADSRVVTGPPSHPSVPHLSQVPPTAGASLAAPALFPLQWEGKEKSLRLFEWTKIIREIC